MIFGMMSKDSSTMPSRLSTTPRKVIADLSNPHGIDTFMEHLSFCESCHPDGILLSGRPLSTSTLIEQKIVRKLSALIELLRDSKGFLT